MASLSGAIALEAENGYSPLNSVVELSEELQGRGCVRNGHSEPQRVARQKRDHLGDVTDDESASFQEQRGPVQLAP